MNARKKSSNATWLSRRSQSWRRESSISFNVFIFCLICNNKGLTTLYELTFLVDFPILSRALLPSKSEKRNVSSNIYLFSTWNFPPSSSRSSNSIRNARKRKLKHKVGILSQASLRSVLFSIGSKALCELCLGICALMSLSKAPRRSLPFN